jgi:hypothetical protein
MSEVADFTIMAHPEREKTPMTATHRKAAADIKDFPSRVHGRPKIIMQGKSFIGLGISIPVNPY